MSLVFLGDVSLPPGLSPTLPSDFPSFEAPAVANLEGPILDLTTSPTGVWNSPGVLDRDSLVPVSCERKRICDTFSSLPSSGRAQ